MFSAKVIIYVKFEIVPSPEIFHRCFSLRVFTRLIIESFKSISILFSYFVGMKTYENHALKWACTELAVFKAVRPTKRMWYVQNPAAHTATT